MKAMIAFTVLVSLSAAVTFAECPYPSGPKGMPDGSKASLEEMLAMKKAVKDYDDATSTYLDCIKREHDEALTSLGDKVTDKQKADLNRIEADRHNAALSQLQGVADRFNEQVRIFKARDKH